MRWTVWETALREWVKRACGSHPWKDGAHHRGARGARAVAERESDSSRRAGDSKKGDSLLRERAAVKFRFIATEKAHHSLGLLCRCLRVTRSGFYAWQRRPASARATRDRHLKVLIRTSFAGSKGRYGSPRIHRDLREDHQERVSRKRVIRLMQEESLQARVRKRFRSTTNSHHDQPVARNLLGRQFTAAAANQRWVGDT